MSEESKNGNWGMGFLFFGELKRDHLAEEFGCDWLKVGREQSIC